MRGTESNEASTEGASGFLWVILGALALLVIGFFGLKFVTTRSLHRADCIEIIETWKRWTEAGSPHGEKLTEFMKGRRPDLIVSNRLFIINGSNYMTQFAVTNPKSGREGTLFVTTNKTLIWVDSSGEPATLSFEW